MPVLFRNSGSSTTGFTLVTNEGTVASAAGKIVVTAPGNVNAWDHLGFYLSTTLPGSVNMSFEYDFETNGLSGGNHIFLVTHNGPPPLHNNGLGMWYEFGNDADQIGTIRDANHTAGNPLSSAITVNTQAHLKHVIKSDGSHSVFVDNSTAFATAVGPASAGEYSNGRTNGNSTQNGDFNNTTNPLTIVGAMTTYSATDPFGNACFMLNKLVKIDSEEMLVTAISGNDVTLSRGQRGTTIASHANGVSILLIFYLWFYYNHGANNVITKFQNFIITDNNTYTPQTPSNLVATANGQTQVDLTWTDNGTSVSEDVFAIERSLTSGSGFSEITTVNQGTNSYSDTGKSPGTTYYYKIRSRIAYKGTDYNSSYTSEANATTDPAPGGGGGESDTFLLLED